MQRKYRANEIANGKLFTGLSDFVDFSRHICANSAILFRFPVGLTGLSKQTDQLDLVHSLLPS